MLRVISVSEVKKEKVRRDNKPSREFISVMTKTENGLFDSSTALNTNIWQIYNSAGQPIWTVDVAAIQALRGKIVPSVTIGGKTYTGTILTVNHVPYRNWNGNMQSNTRVVVFPHEETKIDSIIAAVRAQAQANADAQASETPTETPAEVEVNVEEQVTA